LSRDADQDVAPRQPGHVLGARQVRGTPADARRRWPSLAAQDRHDGRPRRPLRALRRAPGSRVRLRLRPGSARPEVLTPRRVRVTASRLLGVRSDASWPRSDGKRRRQTEKNLPRPATREPTEAPSPVVLVVEDVEDSRELYVQYLSFLGYRVYGA